MTLTAIHCTAFNPHAAPPTPPHSTDILHYAGIYGTLHSMTTNDSTASKPTRKRRTIAEVEAEAQALIAKAEAEAQARIEEVEAQMNKLKEQEAEVTVTMTLRATKGKREQMKARAAQRGMSLQAAYDRGADLFLAEEF